MYVVELVKQYIKEVKAKNVTLKQKRHLSVIDRFTNVLFLDTIKYKSKSKSKKQ
jgi:hypothetical protein